MKMGLRVSPKGVVMEEFSYNLSNRFQVCNLAALRFFHTAKNILLKSERLITRQGKMHSLTNRKQDTPFLVYLVVQQWTKSRSTCSLILRKHYWPKIRGGCELRCWGLVMKITPWCQNFKPSGLNIIVQLKPNTASSLPPLNQPCVLEELSGASFCHGSSSCTHSNSHPLIFCQPCQPFNEEL